MVERTCKILDKQKRKRVEERLPRPPAPAQPVQSAQQPSVPVRSRQERLSGTPTPAPAAPAMVQRTKNGLVKRNRNRPEEPAARPAAPSRPPTAVEQAPATRSSRSPEEVRSMLSSFRSGHQRGERGPLPARVNTVPEEEPR
ncbi:hypothetical protein KUTG_03184 [Kutzneria sp. 744]|nr:hypothetical protein KUTG_03184 [Kutzneria sp. 744]